MSAFESYWNRLKDSITDEASRERLEDVASMVGSIYMADAIPGLGEVQMLSQFIDFIDPYGYNKVITRKTLDTILPQQYQLIQDFWVKVSECYVNGDQSKCDELKITPDKLKEFQALPIDLQNKRIKSFTSWLTPYPPEVNYPETYLCQLLDTPDRIESKCKDPLYVKLYSDYFNKNSANYQADAQKAHQEAIDEMTKEIVGDKNDEKNSKIKKEIILCLVLVVIIMIVILFKLSKK